MKLAYISQGNIPSLWAHSIQAMKMAEGLAQHVAEFRLLTQIPSGSRANKRFDYEMFYGITRPFSIVELEGEKYGQSGYYEKVWFSQFYSDALTYLSDKKLDLVFTRAPEAAKLAIQAGIPTILETHSSPGSEVLEPLKEVAQEDALVGVVTIHDLLADNLSLLGVPKEKLYVEHDGVSLESYPKTSKRELREELSLPVDRTIALYAGHLYEHRGIEEIVSAAETLTEVSFIVIGGRVEDVERWRGVTSHIEHLYFLGFKPQAEVPKYLRSADILLMPYSTRQENMVWASPLKMFEYMAASRPIVATRVPCVEGILEDRRNVIIVEPDSGEALVGAIRYLQGNPEFGSVLGENALVDVQPYQWSERAKRILTYYGYL